jgi:hypothetical protein
MKRYHVYKTYFFIKKENVEPFYIIHKAENINQANEGAKMYFAGYLGQKPIGTIKKNLLNKLLKVKSIRLKKL